MKWKKALTCGAALAVMLAWNLGAEEPKAEEPKAEEPKAEAPKADPLAPKKLVLLIADVGTIDTVAKTEEYLNQIKELNIDPLPQLSPGAKSSDPVLAEGTTRIEYFYEFNRYKEQDRERAARNRRMERVYEQLRNSILRDNRDVVVAKNYLQAYLQPYEACIEVVDRANASIAEIEKALGGSDQMDLAASTCFLTVIVQDQQAESKTIQVGNTLIKKTVYSRKAVANVRDYSGKVMFSCTVKGTSSFRQTSAVKSEGHDPTSDLMEDMMKQIAEKIAARFTSTLTIKARGPRGDQDFEPEDVVLYLDGEEFENGSPVVPGTHRLMAEYEGCKPIIRTIPVRPGKQTVTLRAFEKEAPAPEAPAQKQ